MAATRAATRHRRALAEEVEIVEEIQLGCKYILKYEHITTHMFPFRHVHARTYEHPYKRGHKLRKQVVSLLQDLQRLSEKKERLLRQQAAVVSATK